MSLILQRIKAVIKDMKSKKRDASFKRVRCWKCNKKFYSDLTDSKKSIFLCPDCHNE